ncbi:folylpolyglutamate synthase [Xylariaceae sp. FL0255]|nr:folylpolyglutamate synthase [Xylariaceae sp. FL0255]
MDYSAILRILETLRRGPRPEDSPAPAESIIPEINGIPNFRGKPATLGMDKWLRTLGYPNIDLDIVHVAGTKGKGATCAYTECLLRQHGQRTGYPKKTGLYTSPHLCDVRERIRINFEPLSEEKFTEYVSYVYTALGVSNLGANAPRYLQFLALVSFHVFIQENVDVAIYETHQGGEYDATNIIRKPLVTAITTIDRDHMHQLGPTLQHVAWHKAGIFKRGATAFSAPQQSELASVLHARADKEGAPLSFVDVYDTDVPAGAPIPEPKVQLLNFSLACAISNEVLRKTRRVVLSPQDRRQAIETFSWPGRFQKISHSNVTWFLDGAHNELSLDVCAEWFANASFTVDPNNSISRILIFSHFSTHRDSAKLLGALAHYLSRHGMSMQHALFVPCHYSSSPSNDIQLPLLDLYGEPWGAVFPGSCVQKCATSAEAMDSVWKLRGEKIHVLVTGSLHLVGDIINQLDRGVQLKE